MNDSSTLASGLRQAMRPRPVAVRRRGSQATRRNLFGTSGAEIAGPLERGVEVSGLLMLLGRLGDLVAHWRRRSGRLAIRAGIDDLSERQLPASAFAAWLGGSGGSMDPRRGFLVTIWSTASIRMPGPPSFAC